MKPRPLTSAILAVALLSIESLSAQLIFEDSFSTQASLANWTIEVAQASTVELIEGAVVNVDGYLKVFDGDPGATPKAHHDFGPTETGYLDVRMTGTKFAGSGVFILFSADGPLFSLSLNVSNSEIKGILNGLSGMDGREDDVFIEPLNLGLESPTFPYGRDVRLTWGNGTLSMYYTGIDGTVYTRLDKAYAIPEAIPSGVSLAAGFDSANGKTGYFDFIKIYAGVPDGGLPAGEVALPYSQQFLALSSIDDFSLSGESGNTLEMRAGGNELGMNTYLHLEDIAADSHPAADLFFDPVGQGFVQARIAPGGSYQEILVLNDGSGAVHALGVAADSFGISVFLNDALQPLFIEPLSLSESPGSIHARDVAIVWRESGRGDLYWRTASGDVQFIPGIEALASNPVAGLTLSAGSMVATGNSLSIDELKIAEGVPDNGLGSIDSKLPYAADFSQAGDLIGWTIDGTYSLQTDPDGLLILLDDDPGLTTRITRSYPALDYGFAELEFKATEGEQDILALEAAGQTVFTISAVTTSSGYELQVNGLPGPSLTDPFTDGESLADHASRRLRITWDGGTATVQLSSGPGAGVSVENVAALAAGDPDSVVLSAGTPSGSGLEVHVDAFQVQKKARSWDAYAESVTSGGDLPMVDYSMSGYDLGRSGIPEVHELGLPYFDVTDYGAIPDDEISDKAAIEAAIEAVEANNGGVIFFPPGVFLVNEESGNLGEDRTIKVAGSNILIKGSGSGPGGTVLHMRTHLLPTNIDQAWSTPALFQMGASQNPLFVGFTSSSMKPGDTSVSVSSTNGLAPGDTIMLEAQSPALTEHVLEGLSPKSDWSQIINSGPLVRELNRIVSIEGDVLHLEAPLNGSFPAGLRLYLQPLNSHLGVEDLHFKGNFTEAFSHHGNNWSSVSNKARWDNDSRLYAAYMDGGFTAFRISNSQNSWFRRVRLTDVNDGLALTKNFGSSIIECIIDGNTGHNTFASRGGSHNLIGNSLNNTFPGDIGGHHGPSMSGGESGSVIWRHEAVKGPAVDYHAAFPRANLADVVSSWQFNGSGGAAQNLPNHLDELTFWNISINGAWSDKLDFWDFSRTFTGMLRAVYPNLVGLNSQHGYIINESTLGIVESLDGLVHPESLYEAQLELRHLNTPGWVTASRDGFDLLKGLVYHDGAMEVPAYNLDLSADPGATIVTDLANGLHPFLSIGTVTVQLDEGYSFLGWEGDLQHGSERFVLSMTSDVTAKAKVSRMITGPGDIFDGWLEYPGGWHWCELGWIYTGETEHSFWPYFYSVTQDTWVYTAPFLDASSGGYLFYPTPSINSWFYFAKGYYPWYYRFHPTDAGWYYLNESFRAFVQYGGNGVILPID